MLKKISTIWILLLFALSGFAETHVAKAEVDFSNVQIGDHIRLTISLQTDEKNTVIFPVLSDTMNAKIEFISVSDLDTLIERRSRIKTYSRTFTFTIFEAGEYQFPEIPFGVKVPTDNEYVEVLTNAVTIIVEAPEVDLEADIKDIKTVWNIPITFREILPYLLILLGVALFTFAGIYAYRKWKKREPLFVFKPKPIIPPHVEALENLEKLRLKQLWQNNLVKEYYTELTDILRIYTEKELRINAIEMTSDELMDAIQNSELENKSELLLLLRDTLPTADLVKFAKSKPLPDEHDRCFKNVKQFVEITMPKIEENVEANPVLPDKIEEEPS
ncbi:MAG: hypothetical protein FWG79_01120 [Bacteroidales bacterium]|nr:hypothetical protein [Bacteroidales bacterium]